MKKSARRLVGGVLSAALILSCSVTSFAASEYFVDNIPAPDSDGKTAVTVANFGSEPKTFRLYTAVQKNDGSFTVTSEALTLNANASGVLETTVTAEAGEVKSFVWNDSLRPYIPANSELPVPTDVAGPDRTDPAANRTKAYTSFALTWTPDTTGVVDHYEVYKKGASEDVKLGETKQGFFIVYDAEPNATESYYVKSVSKNGITADSDVVEAGSLYMNEIDFSDIVSEDTEIETDYNVTYTNMAEPDAAVAKYATDEDGQFEGVTAGWVGDGQFGMQMYVDEFTTARASLPVRLADGDGTRGAYKSFWTRSGSNLTSGNYNYMHFSLNSDWLKVNKTDEKPVSNVTFEYDYFDNGAKVVGRVKTGTNQYLGTDITGNVSGGTNTWKTSTRAITDFQNLVENGYGTFETVNSPIRFSSFDNSVITEANDYTVPKMYISGVRAWMTDRAGESGTDKQYVYQRYQDGISDGVTMGNYHGAKTRTAADNWGSYWQTSNSAKPADGETTVEEPNHRIGISVDDAYIGKYDNNVTIAFDYMYNSKAENHFVIKYTDINGTVKEVVTDVDVVYGWNNNVSGEFRRAVIQMPSDFSAMNGVVGDQGTFDFAVGKEHNTNMNGVDYSYLCIKNIEVYNTTADHIR